MLEIPEEIEEQSAFDKKSKSIPLATVRSSKLAAMAANLNSDQDVELNQELCDDIGDLEAADVHIVHDPDIQLDDILIIPEMLNEDNIRNDENNVLNSVMNNNSKNTNNSDSVNNTNFNELSSREGEELIFTNNDNLELEKNNSQNGASTSTSSNNLSLSCINPPEADGVCRLGSSQ